MAFDIDEKGCLRVHWELTEEVMDHRSGGYPMDELPDLVENGKVGLRWRVPGIVLRRAARDVNSRMQRAANPLVRRHIGSRDGPKVVGRTPRRWWCL